GLITIDEYRKVAQLDPFDVPHSRALWISPQKAPVPANPQDAAALGVGGDPAAGLGPGGGAPLPQGLEGPNGGSAATAVAEARADAPEDAAAAVAAARTLIPEAPEGEEGAAAAVAQARVESTLSESG
ncbi:hypothetical protein G3I71_50060, partial [Streptomyces sp. SID12501]|nr:hypothetical protein [Streptomyces sp. SID12501]